MKFQEAESIFQKLEHDRRLGHLDAQAYESALNQIRMVDEDGKLWMLQAYSGQWHVKEAGHWHPETPPRERKSQEVSTPKLEDHPGPPPAVRQQQAASPPKKSKKSWLIGGGLVLVAGALVLSSACFWFEGSTRFCSRCQVKPLSSSQPACFAVAGFDEGTRGTYHFNT